MKKGRSGAVALGVVVTLISMICVAPAASAKGPSQGVITGPGLADPIALRDPESPTIGPGLAKVVMQSGFFVGVWGQSGMHRPLAHRPTGSLGPRYTITYTMAIPERPSSQLVQYVFPYAEPQPITFTPPNQVYWGRSKTVGSWYAAPVAFKQTLIGLGLPAAASQASASPVAAETGGTADAVAQGSPALASWLAWILAVVLMVVLVTAVLARNRRSRGTAAAH